MLPESLFALACMISHNGPADVSKAQAQLSGAELAQVQLMIDSGACLPEDLEKLIQSTHYKIENGIIEDASGSNEPTRGCG